MNPGEGLLSGSTISTEVSHDRRNSLTTEETLLKEPSQTDRNSENEGTDRPNFTSTPIESFPILRFTFFKNYLIKAVGTYPCETIG